MKKYKGLDTILLIDDDEATNYYNAAVINKLNLGIETKITYGAQEALNYLTERKDSTDKHSNPKPGIILLDINMPGMSGWDFLQEYDKLKESQQAKFVIAMLTTSLNPDDKDKAEDIDDIKDFLHKPLSEAQVLKIIDANFEKI